MNGDSNYNRSYGWGVCKCGTNCHVGIDRKGKETEVPECDVCKGDRQKAAKEVYAHKHWLSYRERGMKLKREQRAKRKGVA